MTGTVGPRDADVRGLEERPQFPPGSNVLVAGGADGEALEFALSHLLPVGGRSAVVSTDLPPAAVAALPAPAAEASLQVVDCTGSGAPVPADPPVPTVVTRAAAALPAVGEAAVAAVDGDGDDDGGEAAGVVGLCLDSLSTLVERATVQEVYKLLYLLSRRVRSREVRAFYTWDGRAPAKTLRILGRPLDYRVALDEPAGDRVVPLDGSDGGE